MQINHLYIFFKLLWIIEEKNFSKYKINLFNWELFWYEIQMLLCQVISKAVEKDVYKDEMGHQGRYVSCLCGGFIHLHMCNSK